MGKEDAAREEERSLREFSNGFKMFGSLARKLPAISSPKKCKHVRKAVDFGPCATECWSRPTNYVGDQSSHTRRELKRLPEPLVWPKWKHWSCLFRPPVLA